MNNKRMIQVYTGNGKGKTTAAIGQVVRAAGSGLKTYFAMFMKDYVYGELNILSKLSDSIELNHFGNDEFVFRKELPSIELKDEVKKGIIECSNKMISGNYDIIVLDEVLVSIYFQLIDLKDLIEIIENKPADVELILTGRYCPQEILERADLVTEMKEIKHYYREGVLSRKGFDY